MSELVTYTQDQVKLLQETIARGSTPQEFDIFLHACKRTGLDPFMRQIWVVKRWDQSLGRESMSIQVGIDGFRLIADRTGNYSPGRAPEFTYDEKGNLLSATAFVQKRTADGHWHEVAATAHIREYAATKKDGSMTNMWATKPHIMLGKCAEALALRKAFPADLSGLYTKDEMEQATVHEKDEEIITEDQIYELNVALDNCDAGYKEKVLTGLKTAYGATNLSEIPPKKYGAILKAVMENAISDDSQGVRGIGETE